MILETFKKRTRFAVENYFMFPVSQQSSQVLDLRGAATKACDLTHGICLWHRETFFGNPRALFDSSQILQSGIPVQRCTGDLSRKVKNKLEAQFQCRVLQENHQPLILSPAMVDQQRLQISELQFDKLHTLSTFFMLEDEIQNPRKCLFGSPSEAMSWITEVEMVNSLDEVKSSRSIAGKKFSNFEMLDAKRIGFFAEDRSLTWSASTFEWLVLMIQSWTTLIYFLSLSWW